MVAVSEWTKRYNAAGLAERMRREIEPRFLAMVRASEVAIKGLFDSYACPGGYQIIYYDDEGNVLCPTCAKAEYIAEGTRLTGDIYYEGPDEVCCNCNTAIPSAYGDPEGE